MKKVKIFAVAVLFAASALYQVQAGCENQGPNPGTGVCQAEPNNPSGATLCYTVSGGGGNCSGSTVEHLE